MLQHIVPLFERNCLSSPLLFVALFDIRDSEIHRNWPLTMLLGSPIKKSDGVRSDERGGQTSRPPLLSQRARIV